MRSLLNSPFRGCSKIKPDGIFFNQEKDEMNIMKTLSIKDEIKSDFNNSLGSVTKLLLDVYLIELLKSPNDNLQQIKKLLLETDEYFTDRFDFICNDKVTKALEEANVDDNFIAELLGTIKNENAVDLPSGLNNILQALEELIKDEFTESLFFDHSPSDNYISIIGKNLDFIFDYAQDMHSTLDLIQNCDLPNKERMLNITFFSYARTTSTHVESTSKEFIRSSYKLCHLHILKKLIREEHSKESISSIFKTELTGASKKGMGSIDKTLDEFFNFSKFISSPSTSQNLKESFAIFKEFVERRNKITHEDVSAIDDFNFIVKNYAVCNDFLGDILNEYVSAESNRTLVEDILTLSRQIAHQHCNIIRKLYPEAKHCF